MNELLPNQSWYDVLLFDLRKLAFEGIVKTKWQIGQRILADELKFGKPEYGSKRIETLAKDLKVSRADLYYCLQFARQYPRFSNALENLSWREIANKLLPAPKNEKSQKPLPEGKYDVILADPPWEYRNEGVDGAACTEYDTMSIEKLCQLPVKNRTGKNAVLFLWVTNPLLAECFDVISAWGFESKTNFVWHKSNKKTGIGFYVRGVHELLLICIKGQMLPEFTPLSLIESPAGRHSAKPDIYGLIEKMYPGHKYLELFLRGKPAKGWTGWGDEAENGKSNKN